MIVANLATYPPRRAGLLAVARAIAPQVDRLNVVLNEYGHVPEELRALPNLVPVIPDADAKDTGKFLPDVADADFVLLIDDDILYPPDYVARTLEAFLACGRPDIVAGYHASWYRRHGRWFNLRRTHTIPLPHGRGLMHRHVANFAKGRRRALIADQIASGTAILRARDMPPFAFMRDSACFVDVRLARWCHERKLRQVMLSRPAGWLAPIRFAESIYHGFTRRNPPNVTGEILAFAFAIPDSGRPLARVSGWTAG